MEFIILIIGLLLIGGVVGWALKDHEATRYIDLRDRLEPYGHPQTQRPRLRSRL